MAFFLRRGQSLAPDILGLVELGNTDSFQTAEYFTMTLDPERHLTCWQKHVHLTFSHEFDGFSPTILAIL